MRYNEDVHGDVDEQMLATSEDVLCVLVDALVDV